MGTGIVGGVGGGGVGSGMARVGVVSTVNPTIIVTRFAYLPAATLGVLRMVAAGDDTYECYTIERPWAGNVAGRSCIPEGVYAARRRPYFGGGYQCVGLVGVPARADILIHKANRASELRGCIAPGLRLGVIDGEVAVLESGAAFDHVMSALRPFTAKGPGELTVEVRAELGRFGPSGVRL